MVYKILIILILLLNFGCTPTNESLSQLTGADATSKTSKVPGDLGNQAFS